MKRLTVLSLSSQSVTKIEKIFLLYLKQAIIGTIFQATSDDEI